MIWEYLILMLIIELNIFFALHILGLIGVLFREPAPTPIPNGVMLSDEESKKVLKEIIGDDDD